MSLMNFCNVVPNGIVVFVPSYGFLDGLVSYWKRKGVFDRLNSKKKVSTCNNWNRAYS